MKEKSRSQERSVKNAQLFNSFTNTKPGTVVAGQEFCGKGTGVNNVILVLKRQLLYWDVYRETASKKGETVLLFSVLLKS